MILELSGGHEDNESIDNTGQQKMIFFRTPERDYSFLIVFWMLNTNPFSKLLHYNFEKFAIKVAKKRLCFYKLCDIIATICDNNILYFDCNKISLARHML